LKEGTDTENAPSKLFPSSEGVFLNRVGKCKGEHMTVIKSITFCIGWIIAASIGLWAMVLYGAFFAIRELR
jgi:hypothetical protein